MVSCGCLRLPVLLLLFSLAVLPARGGALAAGWQAPSGSAPSPAGSTASASLAPNPALRTLFLVGDSAIGEAAGGSAMAVGGWGEPLAGFFDRTKIKVVDRALGGETSRAYIAEGHWAEALAMVKPGDVVLFEFGPDDPGFVAGTERVPGTLPGIGDELREVVNPATHATEIVHTYGWYIRQFVVETIARGATPILCSPGPRVQWKDGRLVRDAGSYGDWARQIAIEQRVGFLDLNEILAPQYASLGEAKSRPLFVEGTARATAAGAETEAAAVIAGLKGLPHDPLAGYFAAKAEPIQAYRPPPPPPTATP